MERGPTSAGEAFVVNHVRQENSAHATQRADSVNATEWNKYVSEHRFGSLFHRAEWENVFATYRLPVLRFAVRRSGRLAGVLPIVWQRSLLAGNRLVSLPWFDAAGVIADDEAARTALIDQAVGTLEQRGIVSLRIRQIEAFKQFGDTGTDKVLMRLALDADPQSLWDAFRPKVRNQIRKGQKEGLSVKQGGAELLPEFYAVYSQTMRDLGSPPHHRRFFDAVVGTFPSEAQVYAARVDGQTIGAALVLNNGDRLEVPWAASLKRFNPLCVNHVMYWQMIEDACHNGFRWFHFGRSSRDSGTYRFKKQWGAEPVQLNWYELNASGTPVHGGTDVPASYEMAARLWRHLPVWASRSLGPKLIAKLS